MTTTPTIGSGDVLNVNVRSGALGVDVSGGTVGPPGLQGPPGPPGTPASSTLIVGAFENRDPTELPESGFIPADWDAPGNPPRDFQMTIGNSVIYRPTQHLWQFVYFSGDFAAAWLELDPIQGPQGEKGEQGDRGPEGPPGQQGPTGLQGPIGNTGPQGQQGQQGPQGIPGGTGATGATGPTGPPGATGASGDKGDKGDKGDQGDKGDTGDKGEDYDETRITNVEAAVAVHTGQIAILNGQMNAVVQVDLPALTARVAALEAVYRPIIIQDRTADFNLTVDGNDYIFASVPLTVGPHLVSGEFTLELAGGSTQPKLVTIWIVPSTPITGTGQRVTQVVLHPALPVISISLGPARYDMPTSANVVLHARMDPAPGGGGPGGTVVIRARSTAVADLDVAGASAVVSA